MTTPINLKDTQEFKLFYNQRYSQHYMEDWPQKKKDRILEIIKQSKLATTGRALDFGCGNGVWTDIIKKALPSWDVLGTDISSTAISNAEKRYPHLKFFELSDERVFEGGFDFLFSHHVLEHVLDINETFDRMNRFLLKSSSMLHVLPCGNPGSLEYEIASLVRNGIDRRNGRFFFEEAGHLRRLNTAQMNSLAKKYAFHLNRAYYACHYWESMEVIAARNPTSTLAITDQKIALNEEAKWKLRKFRNMLLPISVLRFPALELEERKPWRFRGKRRLFGNLGFGALYPLSFPVNALIKSLGDREWNTSKFEQNGSEMYLLYKRNTG